MNHLLFEQLQRPKLYAPMPFPFWNDEHISKGMLAAHLNQATEGASRNLAFIRRSADWIAEVNAPANGKKLLDLGCGPGLYAEEFCHRGLAVTGVDCSARSIAYAEAQARRKNLPITYHCHNYLTWQTRQVFDTAVMIYCDFGVLATWDRKTLLDQVFALLKPGGTFIFDVFTMRQYAGRRESSSIERYDSGGFWHPEKHICLNSFFRYDDARTFLQQVVVVSENTVKPYYIWEHVFSRQELLADLNAAGFSSVTFYGDIAGSPYAPNGKTIGVVARK